MFSATVNTIMFFRNSLKIREMFGNNPADPTFSAALVLVASLGLSVSTITAAQEDELVFGGWGSPEDQIESEVEAELEEQVEESVSEVTEDTVEETVEESVVDRVEEDVDELVFGGWGGGDRIEEDIEDAVEESLEQEAGEILDESVEEAVEDRVEQQVADTVTEEVEENVEENIDQEVEETVTSTVEEVVEDQLEDTVQDELAQNVESSVEEAVEQGVVSTVEQGVESTVEQGVESTVEQGIESAVDEVVETQVASSVDSEVEVQVAASVEERLESEVDDILEALESNLEVDEGRIQSEQWLVMAEPQVFEELAEEGYLFDTVTDLPALGMRLAEVAGPSSFDITAVRRGVLDVVGKDRAEVDLNHIYTAGTELVAVEEGVAPRAAISMPEAGISAADISAAPRIGMIDSQVDVSHPALVESRIESRTFVPGGAKIPDFHGTAIASIIVANSDAYQGLAPAAEVYAAAVFEEDEERGEIASTVSLLRALDWLISSDVDVINISLAGPPNRLLETALDRAAEQNVLVLAAAGNGGPVARPMYPAAYDTVVAVTAVDTRNQVFRLANRGAYLDIAAPGVGLLHARSGGGYTASSGTSFAVPFAATAAASLVKAQPGKDVMSLLYESAEDLGPPGRDEIYGYGLLRLTGT
jgi:Subtilase family